LAARLTALYDSIYKIDQNPVAFFVLGAGLLRSGASSEKAGLRFLIAAKLRRIWHRDLGEDFKRIVEIGGGTPSPRACCLMALLRGCGHGGPSRVGIQSGGAPFDEALSLGTKLVVAENVAQRGIDLLTAIGGFKIPVARACAQIVLEEIPSEQSTLHCNFRLGVHPVCQPALDGQTLRA
jgi:hypothetical protein